MPFGFTWHTYSACKHITMAFKAALSRKINLKSSTQSILILCFDGLCRAECSFPHCVSKCAAIVLVSRILSTDPSIEIISYPKTPICLSVLPCESHNKGNNVLLFYVFPFVCLQTPHNIFVNFSHPECFRLLLRAELVLATDLRHEQKQTVDESSVQSRKVCFRFQSPRATRPPKSEQWRTQRE